MSDRPAASTLVLCLYIAGNTPNSMLAISNLQASLGDSPHDLEVVDVLEHPERALDDGVFVTPTLVRLAPEPERTMIGSLNEPAALLALLRS
jgi:circadian clock protein KaiB